jgi:hypothetical protein
MVPPWNSGRQENETNITKPFTDRHWETTNVERDPREPSYQAAPFEKSGLDAPSRTPRVSISSPPHQSPGSSGRADVEEDEDNPQFDRLWIEAISEATHHFLDVRDPDKYQMHRVINAVRKGWSGGKSDEIKKWLDGCPVSAS